MALRGRQWWKLLGLAGVVGVAATGAVTLRAERKRRSYTPDEVRSMSPEEVRRYYSDIRASMLKWS